MQHSHIVNNIFQKIEETFAQNRSAHFDADAISISGKCLYLIYGIIFDWFVPCHRMRISMQMPTMRLSACGCACAFACGLYVYGNLSSYPIDKVLLWFTETFSIWWLDERKTRLNSWIMMSRAGRYFLSILQFARWSEDQRRFRLNHFVSE